MSDPQSIWEAHKLILREDFLHHIGRKNSRMNVELSITIANQAQL